MKVLKLLLCFAKNKIIQDANINYIQKLQNIHRLRQSVTIWINKARKILVDRYQKELYKNTARRSYLRKYLKLWISNYIMQVTSVRQEEQAKLFRHRKLLEHSLISWRRDLAITRWEFR